MFEQQCHSGGCRSPAATMWGSGAIYVIDFKAESIAATRRPRCTLPDWRRLGLRRDRIAGTATRAVSTLRRCPCWPPKRPPTGGFQRGRHTYIFEQACRSRLGSTLVYAPFGSHRRRGNHHPRRIIQSMAAKLVDEHAMQALPLAHRSIQRIADALSSRRLVRCSCPAGAG